MIKFDLIHLVVVVVVVVVILLVLKEVHCTLVVIVWNGCTCKLMAQMMCDTLWSH